MGNTTRIGRSGVTVRLGMAVAFAVLVLGLGAGGVSAEKRVERQENTYLLATARWCTEADEGETCTDLSLEYFDPAKDGGRVACLDIRTSIPEPTDAFPVPSSEQ